MFLAHDSLRRPLLVGLLAAGGIGSAFAAPADQNYDSAPLVILGNPGTLNGIIYFNNDTIKSVSIVNDGWIAAGADHALGFRSSDMGTSTQVGFKTADGSEFKLNSFVLDRGLGGDNLVIVKGYRNNAEVAATTANVANDFATVNVAGNTAWENIDEVRITGTDLDIDIDDLDFSPAVVRPAISNLNGERLWPGVGNSVGLDASADATVSYAPFEALNGGNGNWKDATITAQRAGTAVAWDSFGFSLPVPFSANGGQIFHGGVTIGFYTQSAGEMEITFTDISKPIETSFINQILRGLNYSNNQPVGDATIRITLRDGTLSGSADVAVTSDTIYITTITDTATINTTDGVSFSEAIAIAAADVTGGQTLVFGSGFGNAMVTVTGATSISESLTVDLGSNANLTLAGNGLSLASGTTLTLRNSAGGNTSFGNALGGAGAVTKIGAGRVRLAAASSYTGATTVSAGELCVTGSLNGTSALSVASGATLSGTGSIFSAGSTSTVAVGSGATLSPGVDGTGALGIRGNLSMSSGSTLLAVINGATAGAGYGQVLVNGTVTLGGATLAVTHGYTPGNGDTYTIISNDAADAITGTLSGLAEGSTVTAGGNLTVLTASYIGATGNDFTLTAPLGPVNEAPSLSPANSLVYYTEGGSSALLYPDIVATDVDSSNASGATVTVSDLRAGDVIGMTPGGGWSGSYNSNTGVLSISGSGTFASLQTVLRSVTYSSTSNDPTFGGTDNSRQINLTVTDSDSATSNVAAVVVSLTAANDAPVVANPIPNQNATEDALFNFQFAANAFSDPDSADTLSYSAQLAGGGSLPAWLSFNVANRTFSGTPLNAHVGTVSIDVIANDGNSGSVTDTFNITIANTNDAPTVANVIPNQNATEDAAFNFQFASNTFSDPDVGATLVYSAQLNGGGSLPAWLSFDPLTRTFSGTPTDGDVGTISIDVTADDGNSGSVTDTFNIVIVNVNTAPVLSPVNGVAYTENGTAVALAPTLTITDPDSTTFSGASVWISGTDTSDVLSMVNTSDFTGSYDSSTRLLTLTGSGSLTSLQSLLRTVTYSSTSDNPTNGGTHNTRIVRFTVTDSEGATSDPVNSSVLITAANDAPVVANVIPNQTATGGTVFSFQFAANTFTDVDGDALTYTAELSGGVSLPSWLSFNAATRTFSGTPSNSNAGTISVTVTADDENDGTVADTFDIVVKKSAPVVTSVHSQTEDGTYGGWVPIILEVHFDQVVSVTGVPQLTLETGATDRTVNRLSAPDSNVVLFSYTVGPGDTSVDLDYISSTALVPNGGTIRNAEGTDANLTLPAPGTAGSLGYNYDITIDTAKPTATIAFEDPVLTIGETTTVTITFNEAVTGFTLEDLVAADKLTNLVTTNNIIYTATLAPRADTEAVAQITLNLMRVYDAAGNPGLSALTSGDYTVDTRRPTATLVVADTALKAGESTTVTIQFSEPVTGFELASLSAQNAGFSDLIPQGSNAWVVTLAPNPNVQDTTNVVTLDYTGIEDAKGNEGLGTKESLNYQIDTFRPTAGIVVTDEALKAGETTRVTITFNEAVTGFTADDIEVENGTLGLISTVNNTVFTATLTPAVNIEDATNVITVDNTGVIDGQGNAGTGISESNNYAIDTAVPVVTSVVFTPGTYTEGQQIQVTVTFSEPLTALVPDSPITAVYGITLTPDHGTDFAAATYLLPSGNSMALISTVLAGVADTDGITPGAVLSGAPVLADAAGNPLDVTLRNISGASGVFVDSIAPVVPTPIPDQAVLIGEDPVTIDLTQHFTDIGSTAMTFDVFSNSDNTKASASITGNTLTVSGLANGVTDITIRADDGHGGIVLDTFQATVGTAEPTPVQPVLSGTLNRQTGLFELTVSVTNTTPQPLNGLRLHVDFSAYLAQHPSLRLYNATATTAPGIAHVDHAFPMAVNDAISVKLSFYTSTRLFPDPFEPVLTVETLPSSALPDTNGNGVQPRMVDLPDGNKLIEFPAEAGKWYRVRYSHDMVNWYDSPVPLQAGANRVQWIDSGPPFTQSPPSSVPSRFYIVNEITAP